jgi:hypothetical protein
MIRKTAASVGDDAPGLGAALREKLVLLASYVRMPAITLMVMPWLGRFLHQSPRIRLHLWAIRSRSPLAAVVHTITRSRSYCCRFRYGRLTRWTRLCATNPIINCVPRLLPGCAIHLHSERLLHRADYSERSTVKDRSFNPSACFCKKRRRMSRTN